jgi:HSP20 family molecular chaperone IbpA
MIRLLDYGLYQKFKTLGAFDTFYDVQENDEEFIFTMGIPGLTQKDVDLRIRDNKRLIIKSLKESKYTPEFSYSFVLPTGIIEKDTYANIENGILEVHMYKKKPEEYKVKLR